MLSPVEMGTTIMKYVITKNVSTRTATSLLSLIRMVMGFSAQLVMGITKFGWMEFLLEEVANMATVILLTFVTH